MKFAIGNTSDQWWTGECWGVKEARKEYDSPDDLPDELPCDNWDQSNSWKRHDYSSGYDIQYHADVENADDGATVVGVGI